MKKQKIQMILILVVLVLCIGAYFLVSHMAKQEEQKQKDSETEGQTTIAEIDADKVDAFSYEVDGKTYAYTRDDAVYLVDSTLKDTFSKTVDTLVKEEDTETEKTTE